MGISFLFMQWAARCGLGSLSGAVVLQRIIYQFWKLVLTFLWCFHTTAALRWIDLTGSAAECFDADGCSNHFLLPEAFSPVQRGSSSSRGAFALFKPPGAKTKGGTEKRLAAWPCS